MGSRYALARSTHRLGPDPGAGSLDMEGDAVTHTPGPWKRNRLGQLTGSNGEQVVLASEGFAFGSTVDWPSAKGNALLCKSAPDMLSALEDLFGHDTEAYYLSYMKYARCHRGLVDIEDCWRCSRNLKAIRAIAKAKGEE